MKKRSQMVAITKDLLKKGPTRMQENIKQKKIPIQQFHRCFGDTMTVTTGPLYYILLFQHKVNLHQTYM